MLAKILGIILIAIGGYFGFFVLFQLIGSVFGMLFVLIKLLVSMALLYVGYRMITKE